MTDLIVPPGVDELPEAPVRGDRVTFRNLAEAFVAALDPFREQLVALADNVYNNATFASEIDVEGVVITSHTHDLADLSEKNYSSLDSPPDDDDMHTLTAETSVSDSDEVLIYDESAGAYRRMTRANFLSGVAGSTQPYDIPIIYNGSPTDGYVLLTIEMVRTITIPAGLTSSLLKAKTAATAEAVFTLKKDDVSFGTMTFAASGTTASLAAASETVLNAGDVLTLVCPATADATLADLYGMIVGSR